VAFAAGIAVAVAAAPVGVKVAAVSADAASSHGIAKKACISREAVKLHDQMRLAWTDHAFWTWSYIVSALAGLEDQQAVLNRLLRNQQDIGRLIVPYSGEAAGKQFTKLLTEHIQLAGKLIDAVKAGQSAEAEEFNRLWYKNASDIALFLSQLNPNWPYEKLKQMMETHLRFLAGEINARLNKNWEVDIATVDKNKHHLIELADLLSIGIMKQFPKKFR